MADSLADILAAAKAKQGSHYQQCGVSLVLQGMNPKDRDVLEEALADPAIYSTTLCEVIKARGLGDIKERTMQRHRKGSCSCD